MNMALLLKGRPEDLKEVIKDFKSIYRNKIMLVKYVSSNGRILITPEKK